MTSLRIGVFDSGVGGLSVANAVKREFPEASVELVQDNANLPYGTKSSEVLFDLVCPLLEDLATRTDVIVIACNTVSTTLASQIREALTVPIVAIEPMIKPAAELTRSQVVAVCATPTTLASERYKYLKNQFAEDLQIIEPNCSNWAEMIEANALHKDEITQLVESVCVQGADVIVLGCTHYHWIEQTITELANGRASVLQPEIAVLKQLRRVIEQLA